jgi:hypothetical protein
MAKNQKVSDANPEVDQNATVSNSVQILKKFTINDVMGSKAHIKAGRDEFVPLFSFAGRCISVSPKTTQFGEYFQLNGEFHIKRNDGARFMASVAMLPKDIETMIVSALEREGSKSVELALNVAIEPSEKGSLGYRFVYTTIKAPEADQSLLLLLGE